MTTRWSVLIFGLLLSLGWALPPDSSPSRVRREDPTAVEVPQGSVTVQTRRQTYWCDKAAWMAPIEAQAWADALALAKEAAKWKPGETWQPAMDLFMGTESVKDPHKKTIRSGLDNEVAAHSPNTIFPEAVIYVYCGDAEGDINGHKKGSICKKMRKGEWVYPFATSWVDRGSFWNDYYIVLCPRFFAEKQSLFTMLAKMDQGIIDKNNASAYKFSWGHTYYHELMHLDPVVASREVGDSAYGACLVSWLAKWRGTAAALVNADSWAMFASASYFQSFFNLAAPGKPDCSNQNFLDSETAPENGDPEVWFDGASDRADTFNATGIPPPPPGAATPAPDGPTPVLPFNPEATPDGLATPFPDAVKWFADRLNSQPPSSTDTGSGASPTGGLDGRDMTKTCRDWDIKDNRYLVATCKTYDGQDRKTQEDLALCLSYDNGALIPTDNGQFVKDCNNCFFNPPNWNDHSTLWCVCKNDKDPFAKSSSVKLDDFVMIQNGFLVCFNHFSAPTS